jgi:phosphate starvation-inducible PhoH-like protein
LANTELKLSLDSEAMAELLGANDRNLDTIADSFHTRIINREDRFILMDADEKTAERISSVLMSLASLAEKGTHITQQDTIYACRLAAKDEKIDFLSLSRIVIGRTAGGRPIFPKTIGQMRFAEAMQAKTIVFATGPAGTGKTYLAVAAAVAALKKEDVKRIVLTRPAVEAGENLGFLPGDLKEKVDPYLTPLYDALHDMLGTEASDRLLEKGTIEIAPLAYMRGRTLNDAFIILDEAQNTTASQMKMFLTRLGFHSRMVITGDVTQIDLDGRQESGLLQAVRILEGIDDISVIAMSADDVVRNPLVQKIIERYEAAGRR